MNTFKEIGWLREDFADGHEGYWEKKTLMPEPQSEMIDPRSFNTVIEVGNSIFKSGPKHIIKGEPTPYVQLDLTLQSQSNCACFLNQRRALLLRECARETQWVLPKATTK